jgi:hypothetical protein
MNNFNFCSSRVLRITILALTVSHWGLSVSFAVSDEPKQGDPVSANVPSKSKPGSPLHIQKARIAYTGRLLGYFRVPDKQKMNPTTGGCPPLGNDSSQPAKMFQDERDQGLGKSDLLLGTGDNFGVDLYSRILFDPSGIAHHKDNCRWNGSQWECPAGKPPNQVGPDNVGCFLITTAYDAIVPGVHDFYFGPDRLQELAAFLRNPPNGNPVRMLAANLVVQTSYAQKKQPTQEISKNAVVDTKGDLITMTNISDGSYVYPWLNQIDLELKGVDPRTLTVQLCGPDKSVATLNIDWTKDCSHIDSGTEPDSFVEHHPCEGSSACLSISLQGLKRMRGEPSAQLIPNKNYAICLTSPALKKPLCSRVLTYQPFLDSSWAHTSNADNPCDQFHLPCLVKQLDDGTEVAVFGVVDPEMNQYVGLLNYAWNNRNQRYLTEATANDPVRALADELTYFRSFSGLKVLLANMVYSEAQELAARVEVKSRMPGFDAVIALGDHERFTRDQTVTLDGSRNGPDFGSRPFTAVPKEFPFKNGSLDVELQILTIKREDAESGESKLKLEAKHVQSGNSNLAPSVALGSKDCPTLFKKEVSEALERLDPQLSNYAGDCQRAFTELVGESLRQVRQADLALVQKRDIYWNPNAVFSHTTDSLQMVLDRLLWKGDFLYVARIPGKTILRMLEESKGFATGDQDPLKGEHVTNRDLEVVGVQLRDDHQYYVEALPLDSSRLYTVATTDYIGLGDTGYPELSTDDQSHPIRPLDVPGPLLYVSAIVCKQIAQSGTGCEPPIPSNDYFPVSNSQPLIAKNKTSTDGASTVFGKTAKPVVKGFPADFENRVQEHRVMSFSLQKGSINFSATRHKLTEADQQTTFGGIQIAELSANRGHNFGIDQLATFSVSGEKAEWFASEQATYNVQVNRQNSAPTQVLQKTNFFAPEAGLRLHISKERPHHVLVLAPLYIQTQFADPFTTVKLKDPKGNSQPVTFRQEKLIGILPRIGWRYEGTKNWFEFGYEQGVERDGIREFDFLTGTALVRCIPTAEQSLQGCINANQTSINTTSQIMKLYETKHRRGLYTDFKFQIPIYQQLTYTMQDQGEFFFTDSRDNTTDTRFINRLTNSFSVPVFGNLALKPEFDVFFFTNQIEKHFYWEYRTQISLDYTFDWYRGNGFWTAMKYKKARANGGSP